MPMAFRIVAAKYRDQALDGEGARLFGGRWNSVGVPMVYLADSRALAALECLVHFQHGSKFPAYAIVALEIDESMVHIWEQSQLPQDWRFEPPVDATQQAGDRWADARESAVLCVPSAVIPQEKNYLLNPLHLDAGKIRVLETSVFEFDARLLKSRKSS